MRVGLRTKGRWLVAVPPLGAASPHFVESVFSEPVTSMPAASDHWNAVRPILGRALTS